MACFNKLFDLGIIGINFAIKLQKDNTVIMLFVLSFLLFLGQGLGFQNSWTDPIPGSFELPSFTTFDYKWQDHNFSDIEKESI